MAKKNLFKNVASIYQYATVAGGQVGYWETEEEARQALAKFKALGIKASAISRELHTKLYK